MNTTTAPATGRLCGIGMRKPTPPTTTDRGPALTFRLRRAPGRPIVVLVPVKVFPRAVARNRVRRQVTEAFRRLDGHTPPGLQCIISVRHTGVPEGRDMDRALFELLNQSGIVVR